MPLLEFIPHFINMRARHVIQMSKLADFQRCGNLILDSLLDLHEVQLFVRRKRKLLFTNLLFAYNPERR